MVKITKIAIIAVILFLPVYGEAGKDSTVGWLGVVIEELSPAMQAALGVDYGVLIAEVVENSPAAAAGLQMGDVIMTLDRVKVNGAEELQDLVKGRPGQEVEIGYLRRQKQKTVLVRLGRRIIKKQRGPTFSPDLPDLPRRLERTLKKTLRRFQLDHDIYQETVDSLRQQILELQRQLQELQQRLQKRSNP
uniref:PDZ domain-containing protein n=1 Tax=candidate division WOR-3 bacterium TaxID=2052148 RepID=A0A7V3V0J2_UNCW3